MENEEKKNKYEYVNGKIIDVSEVEVQVLPNDSEKISRIRLKTNEGFISFKPFREFDELRQVNGYKTRIRKRELLSMTDMPLKIYELNEAIGKRGMCKVKAFYTLWRKMVDNHLEIYRFMRDRDVDKLEILPVDEKVR